MGKGVSNRKAIGPKSRLPALECYTFNDVGNVNDFAKLPDFFEKVKVPSHVTEHIALTCLEQWPPLHGCRADQSQAEIFTEKTLNFTHIANSKKLRVLERRPTQHGTQLADKCHATKINGAGARHLSSYRYASL